MTILDQVETANRIVNYRGDVVPCGGPMQVKRSSLAVVSIKGVEITVHYLPSGQFLAATDIDDACFPTCEIKKIEIGNQDVTRLLDDTALWDEIAEKVERQWR